MARKVVVELNTRNVGKLLKSEETKQYLFELAEDIRQRCTAGSVSPDEYKARAYVASTRVVAQVSPATIHARNSNLRHQTLVKALGEAIRRD